MASINIKTWISKVFTHEGAVASNINAEQQLRRLVMSCLLWEREFYVDGKTIATQIADAVAKVAPHKVAEIAIEAREAQKLRHVPLWIVREMARLESHRPYVGDTLARVIQRPDEITEFLALYWKDGKCPLASQVKKGLAAAFGKFDEYALAKYDRDGAIKLRDVLFLCHAKPKDATGRSTRYERKEGYVPETSGEQLFRKVVDRTLAVPDTWEVSLSGGADKKETFERLIRGNKLGGLALLRNLRNMSEAKVDPRLVKNALSTMRTDRILPFRFIAAARAVPQWEPMIEPAMLGMLEGVEKLPGTTGILIDVSGSMIAPLSAKSDLHRTDAACGLAILLREICEDPVIASFSNSTVYVPPRRGFALRDALVASQPHAGTHLGAAIKSMTSRKGLDRLIVLTDEQSHDKVVVPNLRTYIINVASNRNGIAYDRTVHIDGWSEAVVTFIQRYEQELGVLLPVR